MVDLNSEIGSAASLYTPLSGQGINDSGQIIVNGVVTATGQTVAFLLPPVPLPAAAWLILSSLGGLGALMRRQSLRGQ